ncbi:MAG: hypothetical protein AABX65_03195 [Nanoarchaeota archaeon]
MGFFNTLSQSWKEYKLNFKTILGIMFLFYAIPFIIGLFVNSAILQSAIALNSPANQYFFLLALVGIIFYLINHLAYTGILASSFSKKQWTFAEVLKNGKLFYFKTLGLFILLGIILGILAIIGIIPVFYGTIGSIATGGMDNAPFLKGLLISILLIIPFIYLFTKWLFAPYALIAEKTGIFASIKRSNQIVRGKWWKTLGYIILLLILTVIVTIILSLPFIIIKPLLVSPGVLAIIKTLTDLILTLLITPITLIFFKNMYLNFKK